MSIIQSLYGEEQEYKVNGATYIVSAAFKHTGRKEDNTSFPTCVKKILTSDFAHLIITEGNDTMAEENVCSAGQHCSRKRNRIRLALPPCTAAFPVMTAWKVTVTRSPIKRNC